MKRTASVLALALVLGASGCKSQESSKGQSGAQVDSATPACICGEPNGDLYGCHFTACAEGVGNPANDLCACGPLVATGARTTAVSYGGAAASRELGRPQALTLQSGGIVRGILRSDDRLSITLELSNGAEQTLTYDELAPRSIYRLMKARVSKDDGGGLMELGNYTRDHGLYAYSKRHYVEALTVDPDLRPKIEVEIEKLRVIASDDLLARARTALQKGDTKEAEKQLSRIINELPNEPAADAARVIMSELAAQAESQRVNDERAPRADASAVEKELAPARKRYHRAVDENRKGMLASAGSSRATKHFKKSVDEGERGRKMVERSVKRNQDMTGFKEAAGSLDAQFIDVMVTANLNLAGIAMVKSSFNNALNEVNRALVLDPSRAEARSMKIRIENAAADSGIGHGWGNGWGGWYLGTGAGVPSGVRAGGIRR